MRSGRLKSWCDMAVRCITARQEIDAYLEAQVRRTERVIVNTLAYVGEQCANTARNAGNYTDRTGNLRSSVGYVLAKDGQVIRASDFKVVEQGGEGSSQGRQFAESRAREFPKGIVLIVVAGMDYAAYVSAVGKNVLDSAELTADVLVPQLLRQLTERKR